VLQAAKRQLPLVPYVVPVAQLAYVIHFVAQDAAAWYCLAPTGTAWHCLVLSKLLVLSGTGLVLSGTVWFCLVLSGTAWYCLIPHHLADADPHSSTSTMLPPPPC
jgi:hypothetical protein